MYYLPQENKREQNSLLSNPKERRNNMENLTLSDIKYVLKVVNKIATEADTCENCPFYINETEECYFAPCRIPCRDWEENI